MSSRVVPCIALPGLADLTWACGEGRVFPYGETQGITQSDVGPGIALPGSRRWNRALGGAGFSAGSASNSVTLGLALAYCSLGQPRVESHLVVLGISGSPTPLAHF